MVSPAQVRPLLAEVLRTGRRQDTGPLGGPVPGGGTHFVTMVKPEVLHGDRAAEVLGEVVRVLGDGKVDILRCAVTTAREFGERGYLLQHYPRLHRVAADGASALSSGASRELAALLDSSAATGALGAFEAMTLDPELDPAALEARCRQAGIHKLGSGSYASVVQLHGRAVVVLNGFLPVLAAGYRGSTGLVGLLECHSEREIEDLRDNLLGELHPGKADPASLRGAVHALVGGPGGIALSEGRNAVHLSAGHLEGMFQSWRYFSAADGQGLDATVLGRSLAELGLPMDAVAALAGDHNVAEQSGETVSPHGATEGLSREQTLESVRRWTAR